MELQSICWHKPQIDTCIKAFIKCFTDIKCPVLIKSNSWIHLILVFMHHTYINIKQGMKLSHRMIRRNKYTIDWCAFRPTCARIYHRAKNRSLRKNSPLDVDSCVKISKQEVQGPWRSAWQLQLGWHWQFFSADLYQKLTAADQIYWNLG